MLGFLPSTHSGGGEEVEEAADRGGLCRLYMRMSTEERDDWRYLVRRIEEEWGNEVVEAW